MRYSSLVLILLSVALYCSADNSVSVHVFGKPLVNYQAYPLEKPLGNENNPPSKFKGSNFIHPLLTPSGFNLTCIQPGDHLHHFGVWWPWKYIQDGLRKINCWEIQAGEGIVQGNHYEEIPDGLIAHAEYIDRQAPEGPSVLIKETTTLLTSACDLNSINGYFLDIKIEQETAVDRPIIIPDYRYSGFSIRATQFWNKDNSSILTNEGRDRYSANFSTARWVLIQGKTDKNADAGILLMSHPENVAHPEKLRTWDTQQNGAVFVNFNPVADEPWTYLPGQIYARNYRLLIFDGLLTRDQSEMLWRKYAGKEFN